MMKKIGIALSLVLLMAGLWAPAAFGAEALKLTDSYPRDGGKGFQVENTGVKLYFNQDVAGKENRKINEKAVKITNAKGKIMPTQIFYSSKENGMMLVLVKGMLEMKTEYTLTVDKSFTASSGETLTTPITVHFTTRDTGKDMKVNMGIMGLMFVGILFFSSRSMKKQREKEAAESQKEEKVNPYKIARETGKPVEEIIAKENKAREKRRKEATRKKLKEESGTRGETGKARKKEEPEEPSEINHYRVPGPRPISASGSTYKTGRKAKAEAEAAARAARGTTKPKNRKGKDRNRKK